MSSNTVKIFFTGKQLIDAVKAVADKAVVKSDEVEGNENYILGQTSEYGHKHLLITADGQNGIDPKSSYESFKVSEYDWGGLNFAGRYSRDSVHQAVRDFSQKLQTKLIELGAKMKINPDIIFDFEGRRYKCPIDAYELGRILLPDGRILGIRSWRETYPPQPNDLYIIENLNAVSATPV